MTTTMTERIRALAAAMLTNLTSLSERPMSHLLGLPAERNDAWIRQARVNVHDFISIHRDVLADPDLDTDWMEIYHATLTSESWSQYARQYLGRLEK